MKDKTGNIEILAKIFALLSRASARKKIYSRKAATAGRDDLAFMLKAISASEEIQARRVMNTFKGQIDPSDDFISTIFEEEIASILSEYSEAITEAENNPGISRILTQLKAAEKRLQSFYSNKDRDISDHDIETYQVCSFCGYLNSGDLPDNCPLCGAAGNTFKTINRG